MNTHGKNGSSTNWLKLAGVAAIVSIVLVLIVQFVALSIWPEAALFKPLDSYPRAAIFTLIPALVATGLFYQLCRRYDQPVPQFNRISIVVLLLSFIPDYALPVPDKTILASSIAAFLHVIAAVSIVGILTRFYTHELFQTK